MSNYGRLRALDDILKERDRQDAQWGGPTGDDGNTEADWMSYIHKQHQQWAYGQNFRERAVKIAALALAAIESMDRKEKKDANA